jgi:hypothetical protein
MANYTKAVDFAVKDGLISGNPAKKIRGTEIDQEYNSIAASSVTKVDKVVGSSGNIVEFGTSAAIVDSGVLVSDLSTKDGGETLTNKTLTAPDINNPDIDGGTMDGTSITGGTVTNTTIANPTTNGGSASNHNLTWTANSSQVVNGVATNLQVVSANIDNPDIDGGTIDSSTLTSVTINSADINNPDIDGGTIDGATFGAGITFTSPTINSPDINGGTMDLTSLDNVSFGNGGVIINTGSRDDFLDSFGISKRRMASLKSPPGYGINLDSSSPQRFQPSNTEETPGVRSGWDTLIGAGGNAGILYTDGAIGAVVFWDIAGTLTTVASNAGITFRLLVDGGLPLVPPVEVVLTGISGSTNEFRFTGSSVFVNGDVPNTFTIQMISDAAVNTAITFSEGSFLGIDLH